MDYGTDFTMKFMDRTRQIVEAYDESDGPYDATLLLNCLVGLLIVPKEKLLNSIPPDPPAKFPDWGLNFPTAKHRTRRRHRPKPIAPNLRSFVTRLRHSVAHFQVTPKIQNGTVTSFRFTGKRGFDVEMPIYQIKEFTRRLSRHLQEEREKIVEKFSARRS
jgi:HEPN pEK499 p136